MTCDPEGGTTSSKKENRKLQISEGRANYSLCFITEFQNGGGGRLPLRHAATHVRKARGNSLLYNAK